MCPLCLLFQSPLLYHWTSPSLHLPLPPDLNPKLSSSAADLSRTESIQIFGIKPTSNNTERCNWILSLQLNLYMQLEFLRYVLYSNPSFLFGNSKCMIQKNRFNTRLIPLYAHPCWSHPAASRCGRPHTCSSPPPTHLLFLPIPPPAASTAERKRWAERWNNGARNTGENRDGNNFNNSVYMGCKQFK